MYRYFRYVVLLSVIFCLSTLLTTLSYKSIENFNPFRCVSQRDEKLIKLTWFIRPYWVPKYFDFTNCEYTNCIYSENASHFNDSEILLFAYRHLSVNIPFKPKHQRWIIFHDESPVHDKPLPAMWKTQFDLFHTYLTNSDIPRRKSLQLRTKKLNKNYSRIWSEKTRFAAWVVSNCRPKSNRNQFVMQLKRYIDIDIYGGCGQNKTLCSSINNTECHVLLSKAYKFYLGLENSMCIDYVTEKLTNGYDKRHDAIVVYSGAPNAEALYAKETFINVENFKTVKELAEALIQIGSNETEYRSILQKKHKYELENIDYLCKTCEAANDIRYKDASRKKRDFNVWYFKDKCKSYKTVALKI